MKKDGQDPQALRDRPQLDERQSYFNSVFIELSDSRDYSAAGTPLNLPTSEILSYCELFYITSLGEREALFKMIRAMDRAYVKVVCEKAEQEREKKTNAAC